MTKFFQSQQTLIWIPQHGSCSGSGILPRIMRKETCGHSTSTCNRAWSLKGTQYFHPAPFAFLGNPAHSLISISIYIYMCIDRSLIYILVLTSPPRQLDNMSMAIRSYYFRIIRLFFFFAFFFFFFFKRKTIVIEKGSRCLWMCVRFKHSVRVHVLINTSYSSTVAEEEETKWYCVVHTAAAAEY